MHMYIETNRERIQNKEIWRQTERKREGDKKKYKEKDEEGGRRCEGAGGAC